MLKLVHTHIQHTSSEWNSSEIPLTVRKLQNATLLNIQMDFQVFYVSGFIWALEL